MILDREGDLVILRGKGFRLDVGGFLMEPTPKELMDRVEAAGTLMLRMYDSAEADHLSIPPKEPGVKQFNRGPRWWMEPVAEEWDGKFKPVNEIVIEYVKPPLLTSPLPALTEQQQLDSCTGR